MLRFGFATNDKWEYPEFPYDPPRGFPEIDGVLSKFNGQNCVYSVLRALLLNWGLDREHQGSIKWNPFRGLVQQSCTVVIKPNLVLHEKEVHFRNSLTSHASVLRPILDYLELLRKQDQIDFEVVIADVPLQSADFRKILSDTGIGPLVAYFASERNFPVRLLDLRKETVNVNEDGFIVNRRQREGDPLGYSMIRLNNSFLDDIVSESAKFSIGDYDDRQTYRMHAKRGGHYYLIPNTILKSNLFINVPKLKTHQKTGITVAMKNLIGINGDKSWIPHFRKGSPLSYGDEYSADHAALKWLYSATTRVLQSRSRSAWRAAKSTMRLLRSVTQDSGEGLPMLAKSHHYSRYNKMIGGAWHGNDTLWRPIFDLNRVLPYLNQLGEISEKPQRAYLCICDGVVAGEGNGPLEPQPRRVGLLSVSDNPVVHDVCAARLMGFDWRKIPLTANTPRLASWFGFTGTTDAIEIFRCNDSQGSTVEGFDSLPDLKLIPPPGWIGHIELANRSADEFKAAMK